MPTRLYGIDHIYLAVQDMGRSEAFYDALMAALGLHKGNKAINGEPHAHYLAPAFQVTLRPARSRADHDPYSPGLHHLCFQTRTVADVDACYETLRTLGIAATAPRHYPEYHREYYATFFEDPDGIRLEIVNRTSYRQRLADRWNELTEFLNPLQRLDQQRQPAFREVITVRDDLLIHRVVLEPGEATAWHSDACRRFTVVVRGSRLRIEYLDSPDCEDVDVHPGQADWDMPQPRVHRAVNAGPDRYEEVVTFYLERPEQIPQPEPGR